MVKARYLGLPIECSGEFNGSVVWNLTGALTCLHLPSCMREEKPICGQQKESRESDICDCDVARFGHIAISRWSRGRNTKNRYVISMVQRLRIRHPRSKILSGIKSFCCRPGDEERKEAAVCK